MLIPGIDLMNGRAVQLRRGREPLLISSRDPLELALEFALYGTPAVIDIDAAMGRGSNRELVKEICRKTGARAGGGIRTEADAKELLRSGAERIILGTALWEDFVKGLPRDRVQAALDTSNGTVMVKGWTQASNTPLQDQLGLVEERASSILCTFIENEGTMEGLGKERVTQLQGRTGLPLTVAGGISGTDNAVEILETGVDVQVGMSLYLGRLNPAEAVSRLVAENSLAPTIVQDESNQVLMLAYSSRHSLKEALTTRTGVYHSRSRNSLWRKGGTSGHTQELISCRLDCDRDAILFRVRQKGPACHTGTHSCFGRKRFEAETLMNIIRHRRGSPGSYTADLLENRKKLDGKVLEEARELTMAANREEVIWEAADLLYFLMVSLESGGCTLQEVLHELEGRQRQ